jgi:serine/threonine-protein kinase
MTDDPRVQQLLDELLASTATATPEEVCKSCPELLPVVRKRWRQVRRLSADLDALFPPPPGTDLPQVPGYEVQAVVGRGGMGVVFRARHLRLNRLVALKMLLAGAYAAPRERARFQREAEAVARLKHPNIVQVYDVGDSDDRAYFTMEYVESGSLSQKLAGTPQPARHAAQLVATLAGAVQAAHERGIVHRDLKPANVLLAEDGTPKVTDFGLARRQDDVADLTQTGMAIGTPSYMAPEQARGHADAVGPAVDVYALGAILYELLTGRPPFRAATATETVQQVISQEPAPPSRLNSQVPRDLETICLKCLQKEPGRRYAGAAALAEDLRRFGEGRPIEARPVAHAERLWRWGRRNPTAAALLATALALVGLALGGGTWFVQQRAERRADAAHLRNQVNTDIDQAAILRNGFHFNEAGKLLEQARLRLGPAGPEDLRRQVEQAQADLNLAQRLDAARLQAALAVGGRFDRRAAEPLYASAFVETGLGREGDDVETVAVRARNSAVRAEIVAALDDWASITSDQSRREWLLAVACEADQNPARNRLRQPELWKDAKRLEQLTQDLSAAELSPQLATALGRLADASGGDAVGLLTAAQARCPQDFWLNFDLGWALRRAQRWDEALSYYRAALALRPEMAGVHDELGMVLIKAGRRDEAIRYFREAVRLDPKFALAYNNLGSALTEHGETDEAMSHYEKAIRLDPQRSAFAHSNLGILLQGKGRLDEAIGHFQDAIRLDLNLAGPHNNLGNVLRQKGRLDEAIGHFQEVVRLDPNLTAARYFLFTCRYGAACAAVRAAEGDDARQPRVDEADRVGLRRRALDWLRANVELTTELLKGRKALDWSLSAWQTDPALAGVRDRDALANLPADERESWQRLWEDVAALREAHNGYAQGQAFAARRDWAKAADCYARALKFGTENEGHFWFEYAALSLLAGDRNYLVLVGTLHFVGHDGLLDLLTRAGHKPETLPASVTR